MIPKLISKVYVINLETSVDRREHIKNEFNRLNITDYEIFKATDKNSVQVRHIEINFVKVSPVLDVIKINVTVQIIFNICLNSKLVQFY